jgi:hypothetical protein
VTGIRYNLGVCLLAFLTRFSIAAGYQAPPTLLAATALIALALVMLALVIPPKNATRAQWHAHAPP